MTITIAPRSAKIVIGTRPTVNTPALSGSVMRFTGGPIRATGEVTLNGAAGDDASNWTVGFLQAQWIETNWVYYRGRTNADGSLFLQRGRPPARPAQACRDSVGAANTIFYNTSAASNGTANGTATSTFPLKLSVSFFDQPSDSANLVEQNIKTGKPNFIAEAQLEFHFCTVLTVRDPAGAFHHQASFYWNQHWQGRFTPQNFTNPPTAYTIRRVEAGMGANTSHIIMGTPSDKRFTGVLTSAQTQNCNQVFQAATAAVALVASPNRHQASVWQNFDVRRP